MVLYSAVLMKTDSKPRLLGLNPDLETSSVSLGKGLEVFYDLAFFLYSLMLPIIRYLPSPKTFCALLLPRFAEVLHVIPPGKYLPVLLNLTLMLPLPQKLSAIPSR